MNAITSRLAAAPISWGLCEVPGWGYQLDPTTVLNQMTSLGFLATEFGPLGFLPTTPSERHALLSAHGLQAIGGFFPVILHDPDINAAAQITAELDAYEAAGAELLVLAATTGREDYDTRPVLDAAGWSTLLTNLEVLNGLARERGIRIVLHPHIGTMIETREDVQQVIDHTTVAFCLDTGHLHVAGADPLHLAKTNTARIAHTHLKDVREDLASQVREGTLSFTDAVRQKVFVPLGDGDVPIAAIIHTLLDHGYDGWFTMEQDTMLAGPEQADQPYSDVQRSVDYLIGLEKELIS